MEATVFIKGLEHLSWDCRKEMERAIKKGMKYKFAYYVMISKTYKMPQPAAPSGGRRKQNNQTEGRIFVNAEEEFFHEAS